MMTEDTPDDERDKPYSSLDQHRREGKELIPPLKDVPRLSLVSWRNKRLPDMLWAALIRTHMPREQALAHFRQIAMVFDDVAEAIEPTCTLTGLTHLPDEISQKVREKILSDPHVENLLRSMLLLDSLPGREAWRELIAGEPSNADWQQLKTAIAHTLDHQSIPSTDCRWVRVVCWLRAGRLRFQRDQTPIFEQLLFYPRFSPKLARPVVRSLEGAISGMDDYRNHMEEWSERFWREVWEKTDCGPGLPCSASVPGEWGTSLQVVKEVRKALQAHYMSTVPSTEANPIHEATFGLAAYSLAVLTELLQAENASRILGRMGLRAILESLITLHYMEKSNDPKIWETYRRYGTGQAKLAYIKLDDYGLEPPEFISQEALEVLANEDQWLEFSEVDLGHWDNTNLRSMAIDTGLKDEYDRIYDWTSAFSHGNWAAVRNSTYDICSNPLHRLHRILREETSPFDDVVEDACSLTERMLERVGKRYPGFDESLYSSA